MQSLQEERMKAAALSRQAAATHKELSEGSEQLRQALSEEQARSAALASELAAAQREIMTQAARSQEAVSAQRGRRRIASTTELRQSLRQEQAVRAPRTRRGTGACRSPRERACGNTARDRDPGRAIAKGSR